MSKKTLGLFHLIMINVIAVDSIRTLTFSATYGFSLVFFYLLAALTFFIPTAFVSAQLGAALPHRGGIYVWVREAFGKKLGLFVIWINWIYNVIWYPTIMALVAGIFTYLFDPHLANNPYYIFISILILFWGATFLNFLGMKASSFFSVIGALIGTIIPILLIAILGIVWAFSSNTIQISFDLKDFFPKANAGNLAFLTNVLFGLLGLEMTATHAYEMRNPQKDYPRSLYISSIIILLTIVFGSLAIAIVVPQKELSLVTGVMQAFDIFATKYHLPWLSPLLASCIILGSLSGAGAWIIGPTKGLLVASHDKSLPSFLTRVNKHDVPVLILIIQAIIVTLLSLFFVFMPSVNSSYWILSAITAQLALVGYIFLFMAALKLYYKKSFCQTYRMPSKKIGLWTSCILGSLSCLLVIFFGFLPPSQLNIHNIFIYETILIGGIFLFCIIPLLFFIKKSKKEI